MVFIIVGILIMYVYMYVCNNIKHACKKGGTTTCRNIVKKHPPKTIVDSKIFNRIALLSSSTEVTNVYH